MNTLFTLPRRLLMGLIRGYQRWLSPMLPPRCRFFPSCSCYGLEAIERYGVVVGGAKTLWRLLRCHPLHPGGVDPVR